MSEETRRIVAMLFTDVVGAASSDDPDETAPVEIDELTRSQVREAVARHRGAWLRDVGDAALCAFDGAQRAVDCALDVQRAFAEGAGFRPRIGLHFGDPAPGSADGAPGGFGDAADVAARVQALAGPGEICATELIVAGLRDHPDAPRFEDLGERDLGRASQPVRIYRIPALSPASPSEGGEREASPPAAVPGTEPPDAAGSWQAPALAVIGAALLAVGTAWWLSRPAAEPEGPAAAPSAASEPAAPIALERAIPPERAAELARLEAFSDARARLLKLRGSGEFRPRVWTDPDPVHDEEHYTVWVEADCECMALLFAVDGSSDQITLLHPNPYSTDGAIQPGSPLQIPSEGSFGLIAVGGAGIDVLKLIALRGSVGFVEDRMADWRAAVVQSAQPDAAGIWRATPDEPERVAELEALLAQLEGAEWDEAAAPLQIVGRPAESG